MGPEIVAEEQVVAQGGAVGRAEVEMVARLARRPAERFATSDALVALVRVAERREALDGHLEVLGQDDDVEVDDRLGREVRHGRAADVLDRDHRATQGGPHPLGQSAEEFRPSRIVVEDANRVGHGGSPACHRHSPSNRLPATRV
jgi:hypothetical protein